MADAIPARSEIRLYTTEGICCAFRCTYAHIAIPKEPLNSSLRRLQEVDNAGAIIDDYRDAGGR